MTEKKGAFDIYIEGLLGRAEKLGVSLEEAAEIEIKKQRETGGEENIELTRDALKFLQSQQRRQE